MGKLGKRKRQLERDNNHIGRGLKTLPIPLEVNLSPPGLDPLNVAITIETLNTLAAQPSICKSVACKPLRAAVHGFQRAAALPEGGLTSKVTAALSDGRWLDARCLLAEMRLREATPKLGALQRWVRMCDAASLSKGGGDEEAGGEGRECGEGERGRSARNPEDQEVWRVLEAILRAVEDGARTSPTTEGIKTPASPGPDVLIKRPTWSVGDAVGGTAFADWESGRLNSSTDIALARKAFRLLHTTQGRDRKPANLYPALIYTCSANTIPDSPPSAPIAKHVSPFHPSVFLLSDVLSATTCRALIAAASAVGFTPDQPTSGTAATQASILAHNFIWLADSGFLSALTARLTPHLPSRFAADGATLRGLNARFRIYRYCPGAVYRPHIDGAWPPSGIDPTTGAYVYDTSSGSAHGVVLSRLTLLVYLNDEFDGGETTFFLPRRDTATGLESWGVRPRCGSALVFPHGEGGGGGLLHEGTGVVKGGKFVIRTDVLYGVE